MVLKDVIKSAFEDVVKAQYEAYLYSLELRGRQDDDELFPIPTVKATDLTFELKYAYAGKLVEGVEIVLDKKKFLKDLKAATTVVVKQGIQALIEYINQNESKKNEAWSTVEAGLQKKELTNYVVSTIMKILKNNFALVLNDQNLFDKSYFEQTVTSNFDLYIIDHFDLTPLNLSPGDKQWLSYAVQPILKEKSKSLEDSVGNRISRRSNQSTSIIVDSEQLKTLPQKSIQHLTLHVKLDDLEEIKVN
ncbi:MAG: hypothetical protein ACI8ZM_002987 [Crocinitomix sp.]|jgi:hypothetical protein